MSTRKTKKTENEIRNTTKAPRKKRAGKRRRKPAGAKARVEPVFDRLQELYPQAETALVHHNPYELLVATILSAQCTDERVNKVTPALFDVAPTPAELHALDVEKLQELIRSTGFYRNKAKSLKGAAAAMVERFGGEVPKTMDELTSLPGVARKTANVVLGSAFGNAVGVVVDTHVKRLSRRLGFTAEESPEKIELDLMDLFPQKHWIRLSHSLILHGRKVCKARRPRCEECVLAPHCPSAPKSNIDSPS